MNSESEDKPWDFAEFPIISVEPNPFVGVSSKLIQIVPWSMPDRTSPTLVRTSKKLASSEGVDTGLLKGISLGFRVNFWMDVEAMAQGPMAQILQISDFKLLIIVDVSTSLFVSRGVPLTFAVSPWCQILTDVGSREGIVQEQDIRGSLQLEMCRYVTEIGMYDMKRIVDSEVEYSQKRLFKAEIYSLLDWDTTNKQFKQHAKTMGIRPTPTKKR